MSTMTGREDQRAALALEPVPTAPQEARRFVDAHLSRWALEALTDDVMLVVSELVTNAVLHARTPLSVRLTRLGHGVRLEVEDQGHHGVSVLPTAPVATDFADVDDLDDEEDLADRLAGESMTGRGLHVVASVADDWGVSQSADAKVVWAEFGIGQRPERQPDGHPAPGSSISDGRRPDPAGSSPDSISGLRAVRLVGVPLRLALASDANLDDLIREFQVVTLDVDGAGDALPARLVALIREVLDRYALPRMEGREAARRAAADGLRLLDVDLLIPPAAVADLRHLLEVLEQVADYCREGRFLSLAPADELVAFRRWYTDELESQVDGHPPRPCPFPTASRAPVLTRRPPSRRRADASNERLLRLQAVTARLSGALDTKVAAETIVSAAIEEMGGRTGSLCMLAADGETVEIVHQAGYAAAVTEHWRRFSASDDTPASEAIRTGEVVWLRSSADRDERYPIFRNTPVVGDASVAVIPVVVPPARSIGALVVGFGEPKDPAREDISFLMALADHAGQALERARLHEAERAAGDRFAFLAEASTVLNASLDATETLFALAQLAVPRLGDWCSVHVLGKAATPEFVVAAHLDPEKRHLAEEINRRWPVHLGPSAIGDCLRDGETQVFQVIGDEMLVMVARDDEHLAALRAIGMASGLVVPIAAGGRILGALAVINGPGRTISTDDRSLAQDIGVRAGAALANAQLFAERSAIAHALQASLLPARLPRDQHIQFAARYVAAGQGLEVGGDFYDVFRAGTGWMVAVGDVRGHGVDAAAVTGLARNTIRALAGLEASPSAILRRLNQVLLQAHTDNDWEDEPRFCSTLLAHVTIESVGDGRVPSTARLQLASAGHPRPLVARVGGGLEYPELHGDILGVLPEIDLADATIEIGPGDTFLLFTDGVTERHDPGRFFDEAGVAIAVQEALGSDADGIVAAVEAACRAWVPGELADDMVILAVQLRS